MLRVRKEYLNPEPSLAEINHALNFCYFCNSEEDVEVSRNIIWLGDGHYKIPVCQKCRKEYKIS